MLPCSGRIQRYPVRRSAVALVIICCYAAIQPTTLLALQIEELQEDKRVSQQALANCQQQLDSLRADYTACTVRLEAGFS